MAIITKLKELMEAPGGELGDPRRSRERWLKNSGRTMMILICEKKNKKKNKDARARAEGLPN